MPQKSKKRARLSLGTDLLNHPFNSRIELRRTEERVGLLLDETKYLPGLTKLISKSPFKAMPRYGRTSKANPKCKFKDSPIMHGKLVDEQLSAHVRTLLNNNKSRGSSNNDPCTKRIIAYLKKMRWTPIAEQFPVFSATLGFGTVVDLICTDEQENIVVIELKTSRHNTCSAYESTANNNSRKFGWPLQDKIASPLQQHMLQPFVATEILKRYYKIRPTISGVLRVGANKLWFYEHEDNWCDRKTTTQLLKVFSKLAKNKAIESNSLSAKNSGDSAHAYRNTIQKGVRGANKPRMRKPRVGPQSLRVGGGVYGHYRKRSPASVSTATKKGIKTKASKKKTMNK
jgi:hypothetical protein